MFPPTLNGVQNAGDTPFTAKFQLRTKFDAFDEVASDAEDFCDRMGLPGYPNVSTRDELTLFNFLIADLHSDDLHKLSPYMWMLSKQSSANISPLHRQLVKNRNIVITEEPQLHLVWSDSRIFVKPLPQYLISHTFWEKCLSYENSLESKHQLCTIRSAALGFLRSYAFLIRYESDFVIATRPENRLIPKGIDYPQLIQLLANVKDRVDDSRVSPRYRYGELRLSRLNFYCKFILYRRFFHRTHRQYGTYLSQFYGPILFVFGFASIFLNAIQVELALEQVLPGQIGSLWVLCKWAGFSTLIFGGVVLTFFLCMVVYMFGKEWSYAIRDRLRNKNVKAIVQGVA